MRHPAPPAVTEYLLSCLTALPFADFARLLARLLGEMGYEDVRLMGATHGRGRNHHGGLDLQASLAGGLSRSLVIAQVKQYREPVPRTYVDELRGTMLRLGAQQGLLFTTSTFAPAALEAVQAAQHSAPVRLINGEQLVDLLLVHGLLVAEGTNPSTQNAAHNRPGERAQSAPLPPAAQTPEGTFSACLPLPPATGSRTLPSEADDPQGTALHIGVHVTFLPIEGQALPAPERSPQTPRRPVPAAARRSRL